MAFLDCPYNPLQSRSVQIHHAHYHTCGGYICGKMKLSITLRTLTGGDALDLAFMFDVGYCWCKQIFYDVLNKWIVDIHLSLIHI